MVNGVEYVKIPHAKTTNRSVFDHLKTVSPDCEPDLPSVIIDYFTTLLSLSYNNFVPEGSF